MRRAKRSCRSSAVPSAPEDKGKGGRFDPVTEADRAAEVAMRRMIESQFPDHGIIGEEFGAKRADAEYVVGARPDRRHQGLHLRPAGPGAS